MIPYLSEAVGVLGANRLRTVLALIGLVVGVAAVIAIEVLGNATAGAMSGIFKGFSDRTFVVYPDSQNGFDPKSGFRISDLATLAGAPHVVAVIPYDQLPVLTSLGHTRTRLNVAPIGSQAGFLTVPVAQGRSIDEADISEHRHTCMLSASAAKKLAADPASLLGAHLRIGYRSCEVVGILRSPASGALNYDFSPDVMEPYTTFTADYLHADRLFEAMVLLDSAASVESAESNVKDLLHTLTGSKFTYVTFDTRQIAAFFNAAFAVIALVIGAIGAISLIVAGIGITNILLVSIVERTREIGIRKAIGAQRRQILLQFFLEAALLTSTGCTIGSILGLATAWSINAAYLVKISGVTVPIQWGPALIVAVVFATVITLLFGTYPAYRAAKLDPIEALRYE